MNVGNFISGIFGASNASSTGAVQQGVPLNAATTAASQLAQPANPGAGLVPPSNAVTANPNESANPNNAPAGSQLDAFKDAFKMPVDDKGNPVQTVDPMSQPLLAMDPVKLAEATKKMNFAGTVDPALMAKALTGDVAAMTQLLNVTGQNAFLASTNANASIIEEAIRKNNARNDAALPDRIRNHELRSREATNPVLNHTAAKPLIDAMKSSLAAANPQLSAAQIQQKAEGYILALTGDLTAQATATAATKLKSTEPDFSSFME